MKEEKKFQAESKELLGLMINSIYSNKEVFLRELISNASDAIDKYKFTAIQSEGKLPIKDYFIRIDKNQEQRYLQVQDNGIGMTKEELEKNLGTIARSGTKEFLKKYEEMKEKKEDVDLIGQFGVGFYSAFMVAKKIEVYTRVYGGKTYLFASDGVESYTVEDIEDESIIPDSGTIVRVYLKDDTDEEKYGAYLLDYSIEDLVKRYSDFIRYPIKMVETHKEDDLDEEGKPIEGKTHDVTEDKTLNSMIPLWKKNKKDVTDEELYEFYKSRFDDYEDPLIALNIKAEGTLEYSALIFIPSHAPYNLYSQDYEKGLALYAKGIFISEKNKDLVPDYLKFVRGLVDSEDLSLNISREMLQKSPLLSKMAKNIEKKIVEKLKELKENDYEKYLKFFQVYGDFLKFGIYSTYGAKKDDLQDLLVFDSLLSEKKISFKDYVDKLKEDQKNIYYASGKTKESILMLPEMKHYKDAGIDVLLLCENIDEFTLQVLGDYASHSFKNITEEDKDSLSDDEKKQIEDLVNNNKRFVDDMTTSLKGKVDEVTFSLKLGDAPVSISSKNGLSLNMENTLNNQAEARKEPESKVKATKVLNLNPNHPLFEKISKVQDEKEVKKIASVLYDEAMMLEGFEIEDKQEFLKNLNDLLTKAY